MRHPNETDYEIFTADDGEMGIRPAERTWVWSPTDEWSGEWMIAEPQDAIPTDQPGWWWHHDIKPGSEPYIVIWPARRSGEPTIGNTRKDAKNLAWHACNEPGGVPFVVKNWDVTRAQVLTACWWVGEHQKQTNLGKHLKKWAKSARDSLARCEYDTISDPPMQTSPYNQT